MVRRGPSLPIDRELGEAGQINLFWLINLRWAAALGQVLTVLVVAIVFAIELPLAWLFGVIGLEAATNLGLERWFQTRRREGWEDAESAAARLQVVVMLADTALLAVQLYLTGGVRNPFSAFFFVHVVLAAVLLRARWAYAGTAFACLCLWGLHHWHRPLPALTERPELQLQGVVVALALVAAITVFFVARVTRALETRSAQLEQERERQARTERLEALGTLAAGAAHELSSPLSTIAVVAKELERRLVSEGAPEDDVADTRLVREEVARCRRILERMNAESGASAGEELVDLSVEALVTATLEDLPEPARVAVSIAPSAAALGLLVPRTGLTQALRAIVSNALDATAAGQTVHLAVARAGDALELVIEDEGEGMDAEHARRALDPFFTTKEPGRGTGLGLFLTRSVVERLGGELSLRSRPGVGTTVHVRLPLASLERPA